MKILIVDDEDSLRTAAGIMLRKAGYQTCEASDGMEALAVFDREHPDLVILDIMIPKLNGFETCAVIRKLCPSVPLLFLSAKSDISDKTIGFGSGGDDYITKPFSQKELLLRIEALLRRCHRNDSPAGETAVTVGDLRIDFSRKEVCLKGTPVNLTPNEYGIISALGRLPGRVMTRTELMEEVWGAEYRNASIGIPSYIRHIREKIEDNPGLPKYIQTVGRLGYRLGD